MVGELRALRRLCLAAVSILAMVLSAAAETKGEAMRIEKENYRGWANTYRLSNGLIEVRVLTDVGPRIIDVRPAGGENLLYVRDAEAGKSGEAEWTFRGGWRLWVSPEKRETTYSLDNAACQAEVSGDLLRVTGPPQRDAGIQKIIEVSLVPERARVLVRGRIRNFGDHPLTYAAWSLPVMRPGGRAFVPLDVGSPSAFDAIRRLILWSYTHVADPRYRFGDALVEIDQSKVQAAPAGESGRRPDESKIGTDSKQGWAAYLLGSTMFLKTWQNEDGERTDGGATTEVYSSHEFLELEHLGPLRTIQPGEEIRLAETWSIVRDVRVADNEPDAVKQLERLVARNRE